jgi:hypothetical protein
MVCVKETFGVITSAGQKRAPPRLPTRRNSKKKGKAGKKRTCLLEFFDGTFINTAAFVDQVASILSEKD